MDSPSVIKMHAEIAKKYVIYQYRRYYVRKNKNDECPTLTANMGSGGHNVPLVKDDFGIRKLTPRECFTLQGYPSSFVLPKVSDSELYKQAGNTISVPVAVRLANAVIGALTHE
jgi:DNA (cytosine-5)-methyltransferase 1